jgi:4-hydroxybenzoate polyprenyltransferase
VLVTAADRSIAERVAQHLDLFDEVIASDGVRNLKGEIKSQELVKRFGRKGFDYVGNDRADLPAWREAHGIVTVNASRAISHAARKLGNVVAEFANQPPLFSTVLRAIRPHQWSKNLLVFVPLLTAKAFDEINAITGELCIFVSFCATASGIYLINDLLDLRADRRHATKKDRPFASGALPLTLGAWLAVALITIGIALAGAVGAGHIIAIYAAISLSYSLKLKRFPLVDVFTLATLYTLRIVAGGVASHHEMSLWLLGFSGFLFLSLALVKRVGEFMNFPQVINTELGRRGYRPADFQMLQMFGTAAAFASSVVLALFVNSSTAFQKYDRPEILWALVPLILFWQCRLWLATARGHMHEDPIVYSFRDWVSWLVVASVIAIVILASL